MEYADKRRGSTKPAQRLANKAGDSTQPKRDALAKVMPMAVVPLVDRKGSDDRDKLESKRSRACRTL